MLTDTTFWIDLLEEQARGELGGARRFLARHRAHQLSVSIITWGELAAGVVRVVDLERMLWRIPVHPLPHQTAWQASRIDRLLIRRGLRLGENDNWIAATALTIGLRLVSRDLSFRHVPGLHVVDY
jgi:predicted nucleic acid-binding protein